MPSDITSIPARFFSCTLRSIPATRYGRMRPSRAASTRTRPRVFEDTGQRIGLDLEPPNAIVAPPPPQLSAGVAPVGARHRLRQLLGAQLAANVRHRFRVADAREHGRVLGHTCIERSLRLSDQAAL